MAFYFDLSSHQELKIDYHKKTHSCTVKLNDELIYSFDDYSSMILGKEVSHSKLGTLFIKFLNDEDGFIVRQNGIEHWNSAGHPRHDLKSVSIINGILGLSYLVHLIFTIRLYITVEVPYWYQTVVDQVFFIAIGYYIFGILGFGAAIFLSQKGKGAGIFIGLIIILLDFLFIVFMVFAMNQPLDLFSIFLLTVKIICIGLLISKIKLIKALKTHKPSQIKFSEEILEEL